MGQLRDCAAQSGSGDPEWEKPQLRVSMIAREARGHG